MILASLFQPSHDSAFVLLGIALALGVIHGVTPDEHTWPITFSYSIGSYSTKGGFKSGLYFSLGFTLQRAIVSELAYFALTGFLSNTKATAFVYLGVGLLMVVSGILLRSNKNEIRFFRVFERFLPSVDTTKQPPFRLAFIHGLVAGMGTGPFAAILYTAIAPVMPSAFIGWLPGALFGFGTLLSQVAFGSAFGRYISTRGFDADARNYIGRTIASATLGLGGIVFVLSSLLLLVFPTVANFSIATGLNIPNLDSINLGLILVIIAVPIIGGTAAVHAVRSVKLSQLGSTKTKGHASAT